MSGLRQVGMFAMGVVVGGSIGSAVIMRVLDSKEKAAKISEENPNKPEQETNYKDQIKEISFKTKTEAEEILKNMNYILDDYEAITVADFYELLGRPHTDTDTTYGWKNLKRASVMRVYSGWKIHLPIPLPITS